jgi:hypothetical protein
MPIIDPNDRETIRDKKLISRLKSGDLVKVRDDDTDLYSDDDNIDKASFLLKPLKILNKNELLTYLCVCGYSDTVKVIHGNEIGRICVNDIKLLK